MKALISKTAEKIRQAEDETGKKRDVHHDLTLGRCSSGLGVSRKLENHGQESKERDFSDTEIQVKHWWGNQKGIHHQQT